MRRYIFALVLSLSFVHLFGNDGIPNPRLFLKKVYFPVVETPAVFKSKVHGKELLVFIEYSDSLNVKGHYMALEEDMTDTLPFRLVAHKRNAILYYNGEKETFRPRVISMDSTHARGYARLSVLGTASFRFDIHEVPAFHDYGNNRYQDTLFAVEEINDIPYAKVMGFWSELADETAVTDKIFRMSNAISEVPLELHLDVFRPQNDTLQKRPLVMLVHGGAFYFGSKDDKSITQWCRHLASMGYVTASIDYRIGFLPTMASIGRAGYRAVQDAHAAMRFLVSHQEDYGIDTSMLFVGGCSAGAITTLNLAFMTNETRPEYTRSSLLAPDLGDINTCGNDIRANFHIKGIIDMWGAMPDTTFMRGHDIPILAFHGDADDIVPYDYDYPFGVAGVLKTMLVEKMYGSSCIVDCAIKSGNKAQLVTFSGYKHSPHVEPATKELNDNFFIIQSMMSDFFYDIVVPQKLEIEEENDHYFVRPYPLSTSWLVEGGVILKSEDNNVWVEWIGNAPKHSITASATLPKGIGMTTTENLY